MDLLKTAPDQLTKYVDFLLGFSRSPRQAIDLLAGKDSSIGKNINLQLFCYAVIGVGLGLVFSLIGGAIGMAPDTSDIVAVVGRIDEKVLPIAALAVLMVTVIAWHFLAKMVEWLLARISKTTDSLGAVVASINASLAFAAWALPLFVAIVIAIRIAALRVVPFPALYFLVVVIPLSLLFPVYFVLALAATHRISVAHAGSLLGFTVVVLIYVSEI